MSRLDGASLQGSGAIGSELERFQLSILYLIALLIRKPRNTFREAL
jgi:hypothetical protein